MLAAGFGPGFNGPLLLVAQSQSAADRAALDRLDRALAAVPGVAAVQTGPAQTGPPQSGPAVDVVQVIPTTAPEAQATSDLIARLRNTVVPRYTDGNTLRVYIGGETATFDDFAAVTSAKLPWLLAAIVGVSFLLLVLAFRSLLIPAITAVMNLLAAAASFGVLTAFFQWGWGTRVFGFGAPSPVDGYLPGLVLAILFGLSMDYQVFLLSRIRERYDQRGDSREAVAFGITSTARLITGAALIMVAVFAGFAAGQLVMFQQMGFGLGIAILIDATIVRTVLMPAWMELLGDRSWYMPKFLNWLPDLRVETQSAHAQDGEPVTGD
jgi:RND superfamily putative drug exporter